MSSINLRQHCCNKRSIIPGGDAIGLSTAYYLAAAKLKADQKGYMFVPDSSPELFVDASGSATDTLHYDDFIAAANPLGRLSGDLREVLMAEYNGRSKCGFRDLFARRGMLENTATVSGDPVAASGDLPQWFKSLDSYVAVKERFNRAARRRLVSSSERNRSQC